MSLRRRVAFELATLAVLTSVYLVAVPRRPMWVDAGLALVGLALVAAAARTTRAEVWGAPGPDGRDRLRHSARHMAIETLAVAVAFAIVARWMGDTGPLFTVTLLATLVPFAVWAAVQQLLFQFYLLGRLRVLLPAFPPIALAGINGVLFGAVHLPDVEVTVLTIVGGAVWSWYYLRDRCLAPIALSHAVLGTTYYYWVRGEDLLLRWLSAAGW